MYTRCAHCHTWFVINAAQLRLGRGEVQCGACLETFDALERLADTPPSGTPALIVPERDEGSGGSAAPAAEDAPAVLRAVPPIGDITLLAGDPAGRAEDGEPEWRAPEVPDLTAIESGVAEVADEEAEAVPPRLDSGPPAAPAPPPAEGLAMAAPPDEHPGVPAVLREDIARLAAVRKARRRRLSFFVGSVVLLLGLVAQYAWFSPDDLVARYPSARPWVAGFCARTGCRVPELRDPRRIRMLSRDVRIHPKYEGALQVTASIVNSAPFPQAYPRIQFTLFNVNGQTIATRVFRPAEYLGSELANADRMRPDAPVQIVLDLVAPEQVAVSFEFRFI